MGFNLSKFKNWNWLFFIFIIILLTILYVVDIDIKNKANEKLTRVNELMKYELVNYAEENEELKRTQIRLINIKSTSDLLKRDIKLYIKSRYTKIPLIVAESISLNIIKYSEQYNISPELILGMIEIESRFNPMAVSKKDARGLMQVMPEWISKLGLKNVSTLHDIDTGIESGIKVFQIHLDETKGNITKALYYYVGRSKPYSELVYASIGKFVIFRTTIDDDKKNSKEMEENGNNEPAVIINK